MIGAAWSLLPARVRGWIVGAAVLAAVAVGAWLWLRTYAAQQRRIGALQVVVQQQTDSIHRLTRRYVALKRAHASDSGRVVQTVTVYRTARAAADTTDWSAEQRRLFALCDSAVTTLHVAYTHATEREAALAPLTVLVPDVVRATATLAGSTAAPTAAGRSAALTMASAGAAAGAVVAGPAGAAVGAAAGTVLSWLIR